MTAQVWDKVMKGLTFWAKNHESRLQAYASNPKYPNLTDEETSFLDLLAVKHDNQLTSGMRDGLVSKLTLVSTNHEMRLRALENKPVVKNGSCVGEYQVGETSKFYPKKAPSGLISCWGFDSYWSPAQTFPEGECEGQKKIQEGEDLWDIYAEWISYYEYWWKQGSLFVRASSNCSKKPNGDIDGDSCYYQCLDNDSTYCEIVTTPIKKSCSDFNETVCKVKSGCTWKQ